MAESVKLRRSAELDRTWRAWWEKIPIPKSLPAGVVRRVDVFAMIGATQSLPENVARSLMDSIGTALDELLADRAMRWSPALGLIDIHYGVLGRQVADLKHSVAISAIERLVHAAMEASSTTGDGAEGVTSRQVDWEKFQAICAKAKVRIDQVQILDVGEALFGSAAPDIKLSQRIWSAVDEILQRSLESGGYCTRYSRNRVLLFFPGFSKAMGDLKRKSVASEISHAGHALIDKSGDAAGGSDSDPDSSIAKAPTPSAGRIKPASEGDDAVRAQANLAFAALAAARSEDLPDPAELELAPEFDLRPVPMWWAKQRTVGGYVLEPVRKIGTEWDRYFPASPTEPDALDLRFLGRGTSRIQEQLATGKSSLVVIPVHWPTLDRARPRERYLIYCSKLLEATRRLLVFELVGIPEDLLQSRVAERIEQLRLCCRAVICRVRLGRRDFGQFKKLPIYSIGVDLGELPDYESGIIPGFDGFMDAVEPHKIKTYAFGLNTKSLLVAVQAAGADFVAGPVIPDSDQAPLGIRDFALSDLYDLPGAA